MYCFQIYDKYWHHLFSKYYKLKQISIYHFIVEDRTDQVYNQASSTSSQETKADQHIETNIQGKQVCFDFFFY